MTNKQKWIDSFWWSLIITLPALYFTDNITIIKIIGTLVIGTLLSYLLFYKVFRYVAKNWLKWEEVK